MKVFQITGKDWVTIFQLFRAFVKFWDITVEDNIKIDVLKSRTSKC
jgi:hypothetical protein